MKPAAGHASARGTSLIEVMLAASITALLTLAVLEGMIFFSRVARDNAELLAADSFAYDLAWCRFNMKYAKLTEGVETGTVTSDGFTPRLYSVPTGWNRLDWERDQPLAWKVTVGPELNGGRLISVDVGWTSSSNQTRTRHVEVFRSTMGRTN